MSSFKGLLGCARRNRGYKGRRLTKGLRCRIEVDDEVERFEAGGCVPQRQWHTRLTMQNVMRFYSRTKHPT